MGYRIEGDRTAGGVNDSHPVDVLVVGAGFGGMYALHRLRSLGFTVRVIEAGGDVGGTWYWNRYPGARCDIESLEYSYSFDDDLQQEWRWTERYAPQPEILRYAEHVADRFDLRRDIVFDTRVVGATYDETTARWRVATRPIVARTIAGDDVGPDETAYDAHFLVMATGCLSTTNLPSVPGIDTFVGDLYHTGRWPQDGVDFTGRRVGVVGTGSSAVQAIPIIAEQADHLTVFQRTPTYAAPAHNGPLDPDHEATVKADYAAFRATNRRRATAFGARYARPSVSAFSDPPDVRNAVYEERWRIGGFAFAQTYADLLTDRDANETAAEFVRDKIRSIVADPDVAELLCPSQPIACKRMCVDTGYYETFNRPNVTLVSVAERPIGALTPRGLVVGTDDGPGQEPVEYEFDAIVFATGYDAITGSLTRIDIRGRGGVALRDQWADGPRTLLGLAVPEFPNMFMITGPGSPSVLANMITAIEQHVDWIGDCLVELRDRRAGEIEATWEAAHEWVDHVNAEADATLYPSCNSWYLGANVPGKPRVFMPVLGFPRYEQHCAEVAAAGYPGFRIT